MATYYKYAERNAESQVNWAQVGKGISDMLTEEVRLREEKKAAYEQAYQIDTERLVNAPQGTWQDGNATVNNFAHDMMAQQLIDYRLLKSGVMNERDYTLRRENYKSGTNTVFDLQKILQAERAATIEAFQKGDLQALNVSNMADVEAYTDFANSKIEIDPYNPNINMSIYETKMVDGKEVRVIKNTSPVNVLKGQLLQKIPAFKLNEVVTKDVDALGVDSEFIYEAASVMRAGSITKLIGYGAIAGEYAKKDKNGNPLYPEFADSIKKFDDAIEQTINGYFANPYNVSSVLTENTGKYSAESYTVYREEAEKDKTKLLKKLDPMTGLYVLDKDGPHYKEQEQEAREYVKKIILGKLDAKREITPTAQTQLQERRPRTEAEMGRADKIKDAENFGRQLGTALKSTNIQERDNAIRYLAQKSGRQVKIDGGIITVQDIDGQYSSEFNLNDDPNKISKSLISAFGVDLPEDTILKFSDSTLSGNRTNTSGSVTGIVSPPPPSNVKILIPTDAFTEESTEAAESLQESLGSEFIVEDLTPSELFDTGNQIKITAPNKKTRTFNTGLGRDAAATAKAEVEAWAKANNVAKPNEEETKAAGNSGTASAGTGNLNASQRKGG